MRFSRQALCGLTGLLFLSSTSLAADCTAPNQVFPWHQTGVNLMWDIRQHTCQDHWWKNIKVIATGNTVWCIKDTKFCYAGYFQIRNHPTQQDCWNILEEIIRYCMTYEYLPSGGVKTTNGGSDTRGKQYSQGWFWNQDMKRDVPAYYRNMTLEDAGDGEAASQVLFVDLDEHGNVTGVAHDFQLQEDGTYKDTLA